LDYGKDGLEVELPDGNVVGVLGLRETTALDRPDEAVRDALRRPIESQPLRDLAKGRRDACIVICDVTRPVPNPVILPQILNELEEAGMSRSDVTILIATGTHRPNLGDELVAMVGQEVVDTCRIVNHICTADEDVRYLGESPNGVPVKLNRHYLDADLKITVGMIEPHFMAGYAGGRKMVMPGVAHLETVQAWHSPRFLEHPNATNGAVQGNPVHEESLAIARMARPDCIVDVALDKAKKIAAVFAGDMEAAWNAGVEFVASHNQSPVSEMVDVVVTTCGGHPLDLTFYQAVKGMVGALPILKRGGTIIVASACTEGVGNAHFHDTLLRIDDIEAFPETIQRDDWTFVPDQWQIEELAKAIRGNRVSLVCEGVPPELAARLFVAPFATVEEAVAEALGRYGEDAKIAVIPKGPYVIPYVDRSLAGVS